MSTGMPEPGLSGKLVTLLGGSGFFGTHVAQDLLQRGCRLRIASRNPQRSFKLRPLAKLGQIQFAPCDIRNPDQLASAVAGSDAVVNLVGAFKGNLDAVQGSGAGRVAEAAAAAGASAFVHISAIGADPGSAIAYQASKAHGEQAVRAAFPAATILRPSVLFGESDQFINMFARMIATWPVLPVFAPDARLQPLYVDDAAAAVLAALEDPRRHGGKIYEIAGPEVITMLDLNRRIAAAQNRKRSFMPLPDGVGSALASASGWLPGVPINADQYAMLRQGNVASRGLPGLSELGITPHPLALYLDRWMIRYRRHGRFSSKLSA